MANYKGQGSHSQVFPTSGQSAFRRHLLPSPHLPVTYPSPTPRTWEALGTHLRKHSKMRTLPLAQPKQRASTHKKDFRHNPQNMDTNSNENQETTKSQPSQPTPKPTSPSLASPSEARAETHGAPTRPAHRVDGRQQRHRQQQDQGAVPRQRVPQVLGRWPGGATSTFWEICKPK